MKKQVIQMENNENEEQRDEIKDKKFAELCTKFVNSLDKLVKKDYIVSIALKDGSFVTAKDISADTIMNYEIEHRDLEKYFYEEEVAEKEEIDLAEFGGLKEDGIIK